MKFNEMDKKMRVYEESLDQTIVPGMYMVARLDGRGFTKLTKETIRYEKPFDKRFSDLMIAVMTELMNSGFEIVYGYTQSDEISLLFRQDTDVFSRKVRKYNSILAGIASAVATKELGVLATFDCRIIPLPSLDHVVDYFRWRQEDAGRNAINAWCYWKLREEGKSGKAADSKLKCLSFEEKNELLFSMGVNYSQVPCWQRRGVAIWFKPYEKIGVNPKTGEEKTVYRKKIFVDTELPIGVVYEGYVLSRVVGID